MSERKKILIFSTAYFPLVGGAEIAVKEITDRLPNIEFDLITARFQSDLPQQEKIGNVMVYRLGPGVPLIDKLLLPWVGAWKTLSLCRRHDYDFFWGIMVSFASGAAYIANLIRSKSSVPVILTLQEGVSEQHMKFRWFGLINLAWRLAFRRTRTITVISSYLADRARRLGFTGDCITVPNGVDVQVFLFGDQWQVDDEVRLVTTSRLSYKNGLDLVIKALPLLPDHITFHVAGTGEEEAKLKSLALELGVAERVIWHGLLSHDVLPAFLKSGHIFIRPSRSEGLGNSFLEAMAAGLPVAAPLVGGIKDFLIDKKTGFIVEPESPKSIAAVISYIIDPANREEVDRIKFQARKLMEESFSWQTVAEKMRLVFTS